MNKSVHCFVEGYLQRPVTPSRVYSSYKLKSAKKIAIMALVWLGAMMSLTAKTQNDIKSSSSNLIKDCVMTAGLLVGDKSLTDYEATYKYTPAIAVAGGTKYVISQGIDFQGSEYDAKMNFLRDIRMKDEKNVVYTVQPNVAVVKLNISNNDTGRYFVEESSFKKGHPPEVSSKTSRAEDSESVADRAKPASGPGNSRGTQWTGRKIAWYGTSIPAGYPKQKEQSVWSYANRSVEAVGATIQNFAVPNGVIREFKSNGSTLDGGRAQLSFTKTTSAINYQNSMISLIGTANEPDLFVFDYGVNDADADASDFSQFDPLDPYNEGNLPNKISIASRDKNTYIGAQNWVIDHLLKAKPNARIAFVTHFSKDANEKKNRWEKLIQVQNALGEYWGFPTCKVYSKTGWINRDGNNTVATYNPDGIHPASASTTQSVDILTVITSDFLKGIF